METIREFASIDRYYFDLKACRVSDGWAQVDTSQDAWYYGTWANPFKLTVITYLEGDIVTKQAATPEEFIEELKSIRQWNIDQGMGFEIDPGFNEALQARFIELGLNDMLH